MKSMKDYSDRRLKNACPQCGTAIGKGNRSSDHVPSKCLLRESEGSAEDQYPSNLPVAFTCRDCNQRFSPDEQYFCVFLNCVLGGSTEPDDHDERRVRSALENDSRMRARIEASKRSETLDGQVYMTWIPESARVHRVIVKNAPVGGEALDGRSVFHAAFTPSLLRRPCGREGVCRRRRRGRPGPAWDRVSGVRGARTVLEDRIGGRGRGGASRFPGNTKRREGRAGRRAPLSHHPSLDASLLRLGRPAPYRPMATV